MRRTTPRSQFDCSCSCSRQTDLHLFSRILQACLKYFAKCPCPRCKINKDKIIEMGTRNDLYRRNHVRIDNDDLHYRINLTRRRMFEEGVSLKSVYMKRVLDPLSLTPTRVRLS